MREQFFVPIVLQFLSISSSVLAYFFLVLNLRVESMGIFAFIISFLNLSFSFVDLGFKSIHYQYSSKPNFNEYFGTFLLIKIILIFFNSILTFILITLFNIWEEKFLGYILIFLISWIFLKLSEILSINLKSKKKVIKCELSNFIVYLILNSIIIIYSFNLDKFQHPLLFLGLVYVMFNFSLLIVLLLISKKEILITKIKKSYIREYFRDTKPIVVYTILYIISEYIGNIIVFYSLGEVFLAHIFIVYSIVINVLVVISNSIIDVYQIYFSHYFEKKNKKAIKTMTYRIEKYFSILFLSILIVIYLNGKLIFSILIPEYVITVPILYIMIIIPYLSAINLAYRRQMVPGKKQKPMAIFDAINRTLTLILMIILIPTELLFLKGFGLGTIGYGVAMLVPNIIMVIGYRVFSKKFFNIKFQKTIFIHLLLIFPCLIVSYLIKCNFLVLWIQNQILLLLISSLLALIIFFGELLALKQLKIEDLIFFLEIIHLKKKRKSKKKTTW